MAVLLVEMQSECGFAHCEDVFEFVAAAGNVNHQVILKISEDANQYLLDDYRDPNSQRASQKILSSLPLYDVDEIYSTLDDTQRPAWVKAFNEHQSFNYDHRVIF
jgi:hypothetical protein